MAVQSKLLLKPKTIWIQKLIDILPHQITMQLLYTGMKKLLRYVYKPNVASFYAKIVILFLVRQDYFKLFLIQFLLEYVFKYLFYSRSKEDQRKIHGPLTHLSMGFAAVAVSGGRKRIAKAFQAVAGMNFKDLALFCHGKAPYFRASTSNVFKFHLNLYIKTLKRSILPLSVAIFIPSFLFEYIAGRPMNAVIYQSIADLQKLTNPSVENLNAHRKSNFTRALRRASLDTCKYGLYLFFGLNSYMQVTEGYWMIIRRPPNVFERFVIGVIGGWPWIFIPESKVLAYNHWVFTTVFDSLTSNDYIINVS